MANTKKLANVLTVLGVITGAILATASAPKLGFLVIVAFIVARIVRATKDYEAEHQQAAEQKERRQSDMQFISLPEVGNLGVGRRLPYRDYLDSLVPYIPYSGYSYPVVQTDPVSELVSWNPRLGFKTLDKSLSVKAETEISSTSVASLLSSPVMAEFMKQNPGQKRYGFTVEREEQGPGFLGFMRTTRRSRQTFWLHC